MRYASLKKYPATKAYQPLNASLFVFCMYVNFDCFNNKFSNLESRWESID